MLLIRYSMDPYQSLPYVGGYAEYRQLGTLRNCWGFEVCGAIKMGSWSAPYPWHFQLSSDEEQQLIIEAREIFKGSV